MPWEGWLNSNAITNEFQSGSSCSWLNPGYAKDNDGQVAVATWSGVGYSDWLCFREFGFESAGRYGGFEIEIKWKGTGSSYRPELRVYVFMTDPETKARSWTPNLETLNNNFRTDVVGTRDYIARGDTTLVYFNPSEFTGTALGGTNFGFALVAWSDLAGTHELSIEYAKIRAYHSRYASTTRYSATQTQYVTWSNAWSNLANVEADDSNNASCAIIGGNQTHDLFCSDFGFVDSDYPEGAELDGIVVEVDNYMTFDAGVGFQSLLYLAKDVRQGPAFTKPALFGMGGEWHWGTGSGNPPKNSEGMRVVEVGTASDLWGLAGSINRSMIVGNPYWGIVLYGINGAGMPTCTWYVNFIRMTLYWSYPPRLIGINEDTEPPEEWLKYYQNRLKDEEQAKALLTGT